MLLYFIEMYSMLLLSQREAHKTFRTVYVAPHPMKSPNKSNSPHGYQHGNQIKGEKEVTLTKHLWHQLQTFLLKFLYLQKLIDITKVNHQAFLAISIHYHVS